MFKGLMWMVLLLMQQASSAAITITYTASPFASVIRDPGIKPGAIAKATIVLDDNSLGVASPYCTTDLAANGFPCNPANTHVVSAILTDGVHSFDMTTAGGFYVAVSPSGRFGRFSFAGSSKSTVDGATTAVQLLLTNLFGAEGPSFNNLTVVTTSPGHSEIDAGANSSGGTFDVATTGSCTKTEPCVNVRLDVNTQVCLTEDGHHFNPSFWNDYPTGPVEQSNNCYGYAANKFVPSGGHDASPQPGRGSNYPEMTPADNVCRTVEGRSVADGLQILPGNAKGCDQACPASTRKIALVMAPGVDYHWYRRDDDGTWSHKPGSLESTRVDADGKIITDPRTANRDETSFGGPNYTQVCSCFCTQPTCAEAIR